MKNFILAALAATALLASVPAFAFTPDPSTRGGETTPNTYDVGPQVYGPHWDGTPDSNGPYPFESMSAAELRKANLSASGYNPRYDFDKYGNVVVAQ